MYEVSSVCAPEGPVSSGVEMKTLRKGQLNRHTRYRPATTTRNTATHAGRVTRWTLHLK